MICDEESARRFVGERCDPKAIAQLEHFAQCLIEENRRQNLIAASTAEKIWERHFADSAQLLDFVSDETSSLLDLGSGAGLPGLVIAIMRPPITVSLVESRRRRIDWLVSAVEELGLANVQVIGRRLETVPPFPVSVITARAFAPLDKLLSLSAPFSTGHTRWVLPKGRSAAQELADLPPLIRAMFHVKPSATSAEAGIIVGQGNMERVL